MNGFAVLAPVVLVAVVGCASGPRVTSYEEAFDDFDKVWDATISVIDKYAFIRERDRRAGRVVGEVRPDNQFFSKTRKVIYGEIYDRGRYYDVEVRVVYEMDDSEADWHRDAYVQPYEWRHVAYDQFLEARLLNEIKNRITGGAFDEKELLTPVAAASAEQEEDPYAQINRTLDEKRVSVDFDGVALSEALQFFRDLGGINIAVDPKAIEAVSAKKVTLKLKDISLRNAISLVLDLADPRLYYGFRHGVLCAGAQAEPVEGATERGSL